MGGGEEVRVALARGRCRSQASPHEPPSAATRAHVGQNHVPAVRDDSHGVRGGLEVGEARRRKDLHLGGTLADLAAMWVGRCRCGEPASTITAKRAGLTLTRSQGRTLR